MSERTQQRWVLVLTAMASFMVALDQLVVSTSLDTIRRDLGASIEDLEWTVNAYSLPFAVLLMTASALGDRLGRRRVFATGLVLFTTASAACALAPGVGWLIAARAVQGAGAAVVLPLAFSLLSAGTPPERRGRALGLFSAITGLAVLGGPLVGGAIAEGLAWEWIFWLNVPVGLVVVPLVLWRVRESVGDRTPLDPAGIVLVTGASLGLVWGLIRADGAGWGSAEVLGALGAGVVLAVAFVAWELRTPAPMLPMRLFALRPFAAGNAAALCLYGSLFSAVFFLAQFLEVAVGYGPFRAGLGLAAWTGTLFFVAPVAGAAVDRGHGRALASTGLALQAAGLAAIALLAAPGLAYWQLVPAFVVAGCGVSMAMPAIQGAILGGVAPADVGKASGTYNTMRQLGGALGVAVTAAVFAAAGGYSSPAAFADGFAPAIAVSAALSLCGAAAATRLPFARTASLPGPVLTTTEGASA